MNDADYAETPRLRTHRWASLALVLLSIVIIAWFGAGWVSPRAHVRVVIPLFLIWFPGHLAHLALPYGGSRFNPGKADIIVRIVGWIGLLLLLGAMYIQYLPSPAHLIRTHRAMELFRLHKVENVSDISVP